LCPRRFSASDSLHSFCQSLPFTHLYFCSSFASCCLRLASSFLSAAFSSLFSSFSSCTAFLCQRLPSLLLSVTALYSPIFPPATRPARLISAFRSFWSAHQEFCLSPDREHRLRQAAQTRFSPCSSPHLAPFAPSRLVPCCLGLSCSPLGFSP
jgi:hypothetical protein